MYEHQVIEWKLTWKDGYLKWICGYANAQGGTLIIGKDDNGNVKGIRNAKKLLEDIPNKIVSTMSIISDVNLIEEYGLEYIEIVVDCYPFLVNYKGKYYYRSGSTMQEIKGMVLVKKCVGLDYFLEIKRMFLYNVIIIKNYGVVTI